MANKIPVLTQLKAVAAAAKNFTMKNVSDLATTAVAAIEEVEQNAVPKTRKVNGKALSADITLNALGRWCGCIRSYAQRICSDYA